MAGLEQIYKETAAQIKADIEIAVAADGYVRLESMRGLLNQVENRIDQLSVEMNRQLSLGFENAAALGLAPFAAAVAADVLIRVNQEAVQFVQNFIAKDGLQLSDRIWRIDSHAREVVGKAVQQAVVQGYSASQAATEFLKAGKSVPAELLAKMSKADAARIGREAGRALLQGSGSPRYNAMRVFRTEINRAHGEAYQAAAFEYSGTIGTRFMLSPNHRQRDICDMHAKVNRYGLGKGVYPKDRNPWPAHPNTISFTVAVFADEVSLEDRKSKETRIDFIKNQPSGLRASILGGQKKRAAFDAGYIPENAIATPWRTVKKKLKRQGVDVAAMTTKSSLPNASKGILPEGLTAKAYKQAYLDVFDSDYFLDATGERLPINGALFERDSGISKIHDRERAPYAALIGRTISSPDMIVQAVETYRDGRTFHKRRYFKTFTVEGRVVPVITIFKRQKSSLPWEPTSGFPVLSGSDVKRLKYYEKQKSLGNVVFNAKK